MAIISSAAMTMSPVMPAEASTIQAKVVSLGSENKMTDRSIKFVVEYTGGKAATTSSCSALMTSVWGEMLFVFKTGDFEKEAPTTWFNSKDIAVSSTTLRCEHWTNVYMYPFEENIESMPTTLTVKWLSSVITSAQGTLVNPDFKGTLNITSPTRGETVGAITTLRYNTYGGAGRVTSEVKVKICRSKCEYANELMQLWPTFKYGSYNNGTATYTKAGEIRVAFDGGGIFEILLLNYYGSVRQESSVLVNVDPSSKSKPTPWGEVLSLISSKGAGVGLSSSLDCGKSALTWGKARACSMRIVSKPGLELNTVVPVTVSTRLNDGDFKAVKSFDVQTNETISISVPVAKSGKSFVIRMTIDGYDQYTNEYSRESTADEEWGPPPLGISVSAPSTVRWGQSFKISVTSNKSGNGSCRVLLNNLSTVASFKLSKGKGSATAKVVWPGPVGSKAMLGLFAYCTVGGVNVTGYGYATGIR
jgi:hypothetical protein